MNALSPVDLSPLDIAYFPTDYPVRRMRGETARGPLARAIYSRPHKGGRELFGSLIKYGEPWRLGANEATELELFEPVRIQGQQVPPGRYVLYAIPGPNEWVIVFSRNLYSWGLQPDPKYDAFRFNAAVGKSERVLEHFTIVFQSIRGGADLVIGWDDVVTRLPFYFNS